jgi:multiple sugar transport system ATP-binding protein
MKDGITQQVASALEIYNHPTNRFVASFLGSPPMNFFTGKLLEDAGRLFFDEGTGKLPVPDWASAELRPRVGQDIVLGVRPEAMSDKAHARFVTEDNQLNMKVTLVQPLGHKMDVYLQTASHPRSVAQIDSSTCNASTSSSPATTARSSSATRTCRLERTASGAQYGKPGTFKPTENTPRVPSLP